MIMRRVWVGMRRDGVMGRGLGGDFGSIMSISSIQDKTENLATFR